MFLLPDKKRIEVEYAGLKWPAEERIEKEFETAVGLVRPSSFKVDAMIEVQLQCVCVPLQTKLANRKKSASATRV